MDLLNEYKKLLHESEDIYARDIHGCDECQLYGNDCHGGCVGTPNGYIEPPCTSWNDSTIVFEGMYSDYYD
jgi:hypothetical protein